MLALAALLESDGGPNCSPKSSRNAYKIIMADNSQVFVPLVHGDRHGGAPMPLAPSCAPLAPSRAPSVQRDGSRRRASVDNGLLSLGGSLGGYRPASARAARTKEPNQDAGAFDHCSPSLSSELDADASAPRRRRHSNPELSHDEQCEPCPLENADGSDQPRVIFRQKHRPLHRDRALNESVPPILKPARYSNDGYPWRRSSTLSRSMSCATLRSSLRSSCTSSFASGSGSDESDKFDTRWVPSGVDFCENMDVYEFQVDLED